MKREDVKKALGENATEEQVQAVMDLHKVDVEVHKTELGKKDTEIETFKTQLNETQETLKKFDGVDVETLKTQVSDLNKQLETQKTTYETEKAEREYSEWLSKGLESTKVKSVKALQAELGDKLSVLEASKNRDEDLKKILEENKESYAWMVASEEPLDNPVSFTGANNPTGADKNESILRASMGLKAKE